MINESRTDFEAWASQESFDIYRNGDGDYFNKVTQFAWEGWQASRTWALEEARQTIQSLFPQEYVRQTSVYDVCFNNGIHASASAIRSLEGNATKETT